MARWIGVDLDGTLAEYNGQMGASIGDPIPSMVSRVKNWLKAGQEVRIFTARASDPQHRQAVLDWLKQHGLEKFGVTNVKDFDMIQLWDDKARRVEKNKGRLCKGCRAAGHYSSSDESSADHLSKAALLTDC